VTDDGQSQGPQARPGPPRPFGLGIGASTGGPRALLNLVAQLEIPAGVYAFLVQHIHPKFIHVLVRRLAEVAPFPVEEAAPGAIVEPGHLYLAPAGRHLTVERTPAAAYRTQLKDAPPLHGVRPAVDELFRSLAEAFGARAIGVVLTGMGRDGLEGARFIKACGGTILAESEATCVVYGMPRVLAESALADRMVPIGEMAAAIRQAYQGAMAFRAGMPIPIAE
jgi:two-component system chemotaxis response regulator CheB